jgi:hypothetical protein
MLREVPAEVKEQFGDGAGRVVKSEPQRLLDGNRGSVACVDDQPERALWRANAEEDRDRRTGGRDIGQNCVYLHHAGNFTRSRSGNIVLRR